MPTSPAPYAAIDALANQEALDPPASAMGKLVRDAIPRGPVKDVLSGTPLGHAFHPLMTDVPIGTWMSAVILDLIGGEDGEAAADRLIATGLAAAAPTIASGWNDWADTESTNEGVRRVGIVHAVVNASATVLFAASYAARKGGRRGRGKLLSLAGLGSLGVGGWLGGHLAYAQGVGVDTTVFEQGPAEWAAALPESELEEGEPRCAVVAGNPVLLVRQHGRIHALADRCAHRGGALHEGELGDGTITCPLHGSCYRLSDGGVERGPSAYPQPLYEARVMAGTVEVRRAER